MKKVSLIIFIFTLLFCNKVVFAADIYFSSNKVNVTENQNFTTSIYIDTKGVNINNSEAIISFPNDLLSVESINTSGSIFSIWVEQPHFSNTTGTISFNGGIPTPGYNGAKGKILNIIFKTKKAGTAVLSFLSANIYANDGMGTDVTNTKSDTTINLNPYTGATTNDQIISSDQISISPVVTSPEITNPEDWYSINKVTLLWGVPSGVTAVQLLFNNNPTSIPSVTYSPAINTKTINDLSDGVHYFHIRFKNASGWSKTAHFKIKIDTIPPMNLSITPSINPDDLVALKITAVDSLSNIGKYKISLDGIFIEEVTAKDNSANIILPPEKSGNHEISVIAYDRAGNISEKILTFEFPKIKAPEITNHTEAIKKGGTISIAGISYPNTDIRIWIQSENDELKNYTVRTLGDKTFTFKSDAIDSVGLTSFWVEALRTKDVISAPSDKYFVSVNQTEFVKTSLVTIEVLSLLIPIILLILFLIYMSYHGYHRIKRLRRKLLSDLDQTETEAHKIFKIINEDVKQLLKTFDSKKTRIKLSEENIETLDTLSKDIKEAENYFTKRIENIEEKDLDK